jgi:chromosomal replication initiation ATPase DnaA
MKSKEFYKLKKGDKVRLGKKGSIREIQKIMEIDGKTYAIAIERLSGSTRKKNVVYSAGDSKIFNKIK